MAVLCLHLSHPSRSNLHAARGFRHITQVESVQAASAPQQAVSWESWDTAAEQQQPEGLHLVEYFGADLDEHVMAPGGGPLLRTAYIAPLCAVIAAHRKSNDEHIRVTGFPRPPGSRVVGTRRGLPASETLPQ